MHESKLKLPPEQEAIRAKCFHPSGRFKEFPIEDVEKSIPERFEKIARQFPDRIAVKTRSEAVTYRALNSMANRFARSLVERQGPKARLVTLLFEKDVAQIAAMLGVMKAGKFFLTLDPTFPTPALDAMLRNSRAKLVVFNRQNASLAAEVGSGACDLAQWETMMAATSHGDLGFAIQPKALALINYTSGSTGEPKGVLQSHRALLHNIMLRTNCIHVCEHDRISLLSSGTVNTITNSLAALLNGAALCSLDIKREGVLRLAQWLREEKITIAPMSSPLFRNFCEILNGENNFPDLRVLRLRSEAVYKQDADLYKRYFSRTCIFVTGLSSNETGPLRDYLIDHDTVLNDGAVPVGYATPGKDLVLLDQEGEETDIGEVGEIAVRSRYLSPGYLRNPHLTRARFKPDPHKEGKRLYLTGDLGLMFANGCLVYKGRQDFRVKIRGYGVDLKEVENVLRAHSSVKDAVVIARENQAREKCLTAYFTSPSRHVPNSTELRRFLADRLPDYAVPQAFVGLDRMPLTSHNKIDRNALPPPPGSRPFVDSPYTAPRSDLERQLAQIWAEILGIDRVGIHDNFLGLGGHSLTATRLASRAMETFGLDLPLQVLFDSATVANLAAVIGGKREVDCERAAVKSSQASRKQPTRCGAFTRRESLENSRRRISKNQYRNERRWASEAELKPGRVEMGKENRSAFTLPPAWEGIGPACLRAGDTFEEFPCEDLDRSIPARFEKIARAYPDRLAVKRRTGEVTYDELNRAANRIGRAILEKRGEGSEPIAVLLRNPIDGIAAIFGVLKTGKFCFSLDPFLTDEAVQSALDYSRAPLVVTDTVGRLGDYHQNGSSRVLDLAEIDCSIRDSNLNIPISSDALAYLVYTSGSTGSPKGVLLNHTSMLHQVMSYTNGFYFSSSDRMALFAFWGSGQGIKIINCALLNGGSLHPFSVRSEGLSGLADFLIQEEITVCHLSVSLFRYFVSSLPEDKGFPRLRLLRLASQQVLKKDFQNYRKHFSAGAVLVNALSATETGSFCWHIINQDTVISGDTVPVGGPIKGKDILLVDEAGREVGTDRIGEIVVKSRFLSPGYWRDAQLTESKFLPDPNGSDQRLYFTGDLAWRDSTGCLSYVGRKDLRIKIRGFAVDIAQVQNALQEHSGLREAVVVRDESASGESRLIAYFTAHEERRPSTTELRRFLKAKLPDHAIPSVFVMLDAMPLTPSGKVDRRALPNPKRARPDVEVPFVRARTSVEKKLSKIWQEVLGIATVGIQDNFFDLGGHSLTAGQVLARVHKQFHIALPLGQFFQSPTIAALTAEIVKTGPRQDKPVELQPARRDKPLALSFAQRRLWFLDKLEPGSRAYNLFFAYRITGRFNLRAFEQSINTIVRRHEALRTIFEEFDGEPCQRVLSSLLVEVPVLDLRMISGADRESAARRLAVEHARTPFDLTRGPLLRVNLLWIEDNEHILHFSIHHIIYDGWSIGLLMRELSALYAAFAIGRESPLPELRIQYADFAQWQNSWLQSEFLNSQLRYWEKRLEGLVPLQLSAGGPAPRIKTHRGARQFFSLSESLTGRLKSLSGREGVTLFMTLLAAYQILLYRQTGVEDIAIGTPVAGRNRKELESLIGFFLNILVLRTDLAGRPSVREALARVREVCIAALAQQDLPFERLVEELRPGRNADRNPLVEVTFAFQNTPRYPLRFAELDVSELCTDPGIARFDLHLFMLEEDNQLKGYVNYSTDLFDQATIVRMLGHFKALLEAIVTDPERRVSELPILTEAERRQLLIEWNDTEREYPKDKCIHQLFEEQVEKTPEATALVFEDRQLTYRELNTRANQLAHYLQRLGVGPDTLVGICVERSIEMVVGLLAILKAGGAYLPLDPDYPKERLAFMLEDAQAAVLLTQERLLEKLPDHNAKIAVLDKDWEKIARESSCNPENRAVSRNLAYVIYTSGSIGRPKAVEVTHRSVLRLLLGIDYVQLNKNQTFLQLAPLSFDASTFELWGSLLHGARCVLFPGTIPIPEELGKLLGHHEVSTLWLTASLFNTIIDEAPQALCGVSQLLIGGEALSVSHVKRALAHLPRTQISNGYGPTESTTFTCTYAIPSRLDERTSSIPIGRPIANTELYVLDASLSPVPIGVAGELYIGGDGLARGYLNRPELTAERFIPHPFTQEPGRRLYRSGDRARYLPDGQIEFLGRRDHQVKIRGFRIEPGEIESALSQHPSVRDVAVVAREDIAGDKRLVAYLVLSQNRACTTNELRDFAKAKLPEYMVPSAFVVLDSLPLTPNGKLDRKSLPVPDPLGSEFEDAYRAPPTITERTLAGIWTEILKVEKVGFHDNFFDLGGHSLKATRVISRIREALRVELPVRILFEAQTLGELAKMVEAKQTAQEVNAVDQVLAEVESLSEEEIATRH